VVSDEHRTLLEASFRIVRESAIDAFASILRAHQDPSAPRSAYAIRRHAEGAITGLHGMLVRDVSMPRFVEDLGRYLHGITDGSDDTLVDILVHLHRRLQWAIPSEIRDEFEADVTDLCLRLMLGWIQRREQIGMLGGPVASPPVPQDTEAILRAAVDQAPVGVYITDVQTAVPVINNEAHQQLFGYSAEEELALEPEQFEDQDMADGDFELLADLIDGRIPFLERISTRPHKNGQPVPFHLLAWPIRNDAGTITHLANIISPALRPQATAGSGLAEKRMRFLLRLSPDPIVIAADTGEIRYASPSVEAVLGYDPDTLIGESLEMLLAADSRIVGRRMLEEVARTPLAREVAEVEVQLLDGTQRWFELVANNLLMVDDVQGIVIQGRDVTERRALQDQLEHLARTDPLTGLLNRRGFLERLQQWLEEHDSADVREAAAYYIDLDDFKAVNERYGHGGGDAVLVALGDRLAAVVEGRGFAGRIGGDEFVLLADLEDERARKHFTEDLTRALHGTVRHGEQKIIFAGSAGMIDVPPAAQLGSDAERIVQDADDMLRVAKRDRRARSHLEKDLA